MLSERAILIVGGYTSICSESGSRAEPTTVLSIRSRSSIANPYVRRRTENAANGNSTKSCFSIRFFFKANPFSA
uniref:Uncharacterized protein n=1 Tax=Parascaris equorum TaxID=6256 RepID=A0A914RSE2_PAREQ